MPLSGNNNPVSAQIAKRLPIAKWQMVEVNFIATSTDVVVPHNLSPIQPGDVRFEVVDTNTNGTVYRGLKAPGPNYIVLRASAVGYYRIRLILEANAGVTTPLPPTSV